MTARVTIAASVRALQLCVAKRTRNALQLFRCNKKQCRNPPTLCARKNPLVRSPRCVRASRRRLIHDAKDEQPHPGEGQHDHSSPSCISDSLRNRRARKLAGRGRRTAQRVRAHRPARPGHHSGRLHRKTLSQQIGPGQGDINTPGSSAYLIKRDPARAIRRGRQLFQRKFSLFEGFGAARERERQRRHHRGAPARRRSLG